MNNDNSVNDEEAKSFSSKVLRDITNKDLKNSNTILKNKDSNSNSNSYNSINIIQEKNDNIKYEKSNINNESNVYVKKKASKENIPNLSTKEIKNITKNSFQVKNQCLEAKKSSSNENENNVILEPKIQNNQLINSKITYNNQEFSSKNKFNANYPSKPSNIETKNNNVFLKNNTEQNNIQSTSIKSSYLENNVNSNILFDDIGIYNEFQNNEFTLDTNLRQKSIENHCELNLKQSPEPIIQILDQNNKFSKKQSLDLENTTDKQIKFSKSKSSKYYINLIPFDSIQNKQIYKPPFSNKNANNNKIINFGGEFDDKSKIGENNLNNEKNNVLIKKSSKKTKREKSQSIEVSSEVKIKEEVKNLVSHIFELPDTESYQINNRLINDYNFFIKERNLRIQIPYEYINEIEVNMYEEEMNYPLLYGYMDIQNDIVSKMRALLIDWLIDVTFRYNFKDEVIHLTCFIIDYYLTKLIIKRDELQLIGACALLIATKFHEIKPPLINDLVFISDQAYQYDDVIKIEYDILQKINFNLNLPCSLAFFQLFSCKLGFSNFQKNLGMYLLETALLEYEYLRFMPSVRSLSVCYLLLDTNDTQVMEKYKNLEALNNPKIIRECALKFKSIFEYRPDSNVCNFKAVRKKYSSEKYLMVALV